MTKDNKKLLGHQHPINTMIAEINNIFAKIGFVFAEGPEVETEVYNFDRLNVAKDHTSRDMQDTFWLKPSDVSEPTVLRTHTSSVQARYMESHKPPIRIIVPGRVFRNEASDSTHEAEFYQFEGLCIDKDVNLGHLKGVLEYFLSQLFKGQIEIRFRPSYFPFVEPGLEIDMRIISGNSKLSGRWIEVMGAGMVHPNVLRDSGIDPEIYKGFAFGVGVDRLVMMRHDIDDIRLLYSGDLRLINQF